MRFSEKWGDDIDNAVELALRDLKLTRDQVTVTVLAQPSKGFFGIGSKLAKVRVEEIVVEKAVEAPKPEKPAKPEKQVKAEKPVKQEKAEKAEKPEKKEKTQEKAEKPELSSRKERNKKAHAAKKEKAPETEDFEISEEIRLLIEKPEDLKEDNDNPAKAFLESVAKDMDLNVTVKVSSNADCVYVEIDGPDTGTIIGKRGQTLDSIQYLTSLVVNKGKSGYIRVIVDAEGYREKREKTLEKLAYRLADKAVKTGKKVRLEPMNPYERKVIHTALQKRPEVTTRSEGEEPYRRIVIEPSK